MWNICQLFSNFRSKKSDHTVEVFWRKQWYLRLLFVSNIGALHIWDRRQILIFSEAFLKFPPLLLPWEMFCAGYDWYILVPLSGSKITNCGKRPSCMILHQFTRISNWIADGFLKLTRIDLKNQKGHYHHCIYKWHDWSSCSLSLWLCILDLGHHHYGGGSGREEHPRKA